MQMIFKLTMDFTCYIQHIMLIFTGISYCYILEGDDRVVGERLNAIRNIIFRFSHCV